MFCHGNLQHWIYYTLVFSCIVNTQTFKKEWRNLMSHLRSLNNIWLTAFDSKVANNQSANLHQSYCHSILSFNDTLLSMGHIYKVFSSQVFSITFFHSEEPPFWLILDFPIAPILIYYFIGLIYVKKITQPTKPIQSHQITTIFP